MKTVVAFLIKSYQLLISPLFPPSCRFHPSCSEYALQAVRKYGAGRGVWMGFTRLLRCHPFNPGGIDEVR